MISPKNSVIFFLQKHIIFFVTIYALFAKKFLCFVALVFNVRVDHEKLQGLFEAIFTNTIVVFIIVDCANFQLKRVVKALNSNW